MNLNEFAKDGESNMVWEAGETEKPHLVSLTLTIDGAEVTRRFSFGILDEYNVNHLEKAVASMVETITSSKDF